MKEYVRDPEEFRSLAKGRVHWAIVQEPIYISKMDGTGKVDSGDVAIFLDITSQIKEGNHIVAMKIRCGSINRFSENYQERIAKIREAVEIDFPDATEGAFE